MVTLIRNQWSLCSGERWSVCPVFPDKSTMMGITLNDYKARIIILILTILSISTVSTSQVIYNNDAAVNTTISTLTFNFGPIPAGNNRVLVVGVHSGNALTSITDVTYNSVTATSPAISQSNSGATIGTSLWVIPLGSGAMISAMNITVGSTSGSPFRISAASFQEVDQTTMFANANSQNGISSSSTLSISTSNASNMVVDAINILSNAATPVSSTHDFSDANFAVGIGVTAATGATVNNTWTFSNLNFAHAGLELLDVMPEPIPTLSQWGIIALALIMLVFGIVVVRQRKAILG